MLVSLGHGRGEELPLARAPFLATIINGNNTFFYLQYDSGGMPRGGPHLQGGGSRGGPM